MTEAAPIAVTSLLPLVLFPLLGVRSVREVAPNYGDHMVFLFLGGFVLAHAVEHSGLHRRIALSILTAVGASGKRLVWGFLIATAALSMWLSNTATTLMMLAIAAGVAERVAIGRSAPRLLLAVAFGASIGGIGTLIGTPPNVVLAGMAPSLVPGLEALSFGGWMLFGIPLVLCLLPVAGLLLGRGLGGGKGGAAATLAAILPAAPGSRRPLVPWEEIHKGVPWGVLILFAGGFALADAVQATALDDWVAMCLHGLAALPLPVTILAICLFDHGRDRAHLQHGDCDAADADHGRPRPGARGASLSTDGARDRLLFLCVHAAGRHPSQRHRDRLGTRHPARASARGRTAGSGDSCPLPSAACLQSAIRSGGISLSSSLRA